MRDFVFGLIASAAVAWAGVPARAAPARAVSLNLCTDELALLLASPGQLVSVTHLSHDPHESVLWQRARRVRANDGSLLSVAGMKPGVVLAMGGIGRDREHLAGALGARLVTLPYPASFADMLAGIATVARALGREAAGRRLAETLRRARAAAPRRPVEALFLSGGGRVSGGDPLGAAWLAIAGLRQRAVPGGRITIEELMRQPPGLLLLSDYRADQSSRGAAWLRHPALERTRIGRTLTTDGRGWTCMGPTLLAEVLRLRAAIATQ